MFVSAVCGVMTVCCGCDGRTDGMGLVSVVIAVLSLYSSLTTCVTSQNITTTTSSSSSSTTTTATTRALKQIANTSTTTTTTTTTPTTTTATATAVTTPTGQTVITTTAATTTDQSPTTTTLSSDTSSDRSSASYGSIDRGRTSPTSSVRGRKPGEPTSGTRERWIGIIVGPSLAAGMIVAVAVILAILVGIWKCRKEKKCSNCSSESTFAEAVDEPDDDEMCNDVAPPSPPPLPPLDRLDSSTQSAATAAVNGVPHIVEAAPATGSPHYVNVQIINEHNQWTAATADDVSDFERPIVISEPGSPVPQPDYVNWSTTDEPDASGSQYMTLDRPPAGSQSELLESDDRLYVSLRVDKENWVLKSEKRRQRQQPHKVSWKLPSAK